MKVMVKSGPLVFEYDLSEGTYDVYESATGRPVIESACAAVDFVRGGLVLSTREADSRLPSEAAGGLVVAHNFRSAPVRLELHVEPLEEVAGFKLRLSACNDGGGDMRELDFYPLLMECSRGAALFGRGAGHDYRFLRNGFLTWSGSEARRWEESIRRPALRFIFNSCCNPTVPVPRARGHFIGEWYGAVRDVEGGGALVAGFTTTADQLSQIDFKSRGGNFHHLRAVSHGENMTLEAGGSLTSEELTIIAVAGSRETRQGGQAAAPDMDVPLKTYARLAARPKPTPVSGKFPTPPVGWCSWYYYFERLNERVILENLEAAKSLADKLPIDVFQVDDGYQPAPGDWLKSNARFPHGLAWLSRKIVNAGFRPGLWTAPFFATNRSELFKRHRNYFVRDESGAPKWVSIWPQPASLGNKYAIDTTNPEALRWLYATFKTIVREWGFEYLKLDFLYTGAFDGLRWDPRATRAQAFRRGLETIRAAAGDDTYIVGCGIPIALGLGIVNGMRMSGDTAPFWSDPLLDKVLGHTASPSVVNTAQSNFTRYFLNRLWGFSDADCLMCRFSDTRLSRDETLTHAAIVALAGGPLFLSDNLAKLDSHAIRLAQQLIPPLEESAVPVDIFESPIPSTLVKRFDRGYDPVVVVGRFNWHSSATDLPVVFATVGLDENTDYHVYDLWEDHYHGIHRERVTLPRVPGHASRLLSIRPVTGEPQLVATTFHFTQGGVDLTAQKYDAQARRLSISIAAPAVRRGRIYFFCPEGFDPGPCIVDTAHETILRHISGRLFRLDLTIDDSADITVDF